MTTYQFTEHDHARLATLFDAWAIGGATRYSGYKPEVREAPNGDTKACPECEGDGTNGFERRCLACHGTGRVPNVDAGPAAKRWLHVAPKYNPPEWAVEYLARAHYEACRVAEALGVPAAYYPRVADGTLRVLEYPSAGHVRPDEDEGAARCVNCYSGLGDVCPALAPGAGTAEHKDFDLFTIVLWRSTPEDLERPGLSANRHAKACPQYDDSGHLHHLAATGIPCTCAWGMSPGLHIGELGELVGLGPATPHRVPARPYAQKSIIYFALPDHAAVLPQYYERGMSKGGQTVGQWLKERVARSRYMGLEP